MLCPEYPLRLGTIAGTIATSVDSVRGQDCGTAEVQYAAFDDLTGNHPRYVQKRFAKT